MAQPSDKVRAYRPLLQMLAFELLAEFEREMDGKAQANTEPADLASAARARESDSQADQATRSQRAAAL